MNTPLPDSSHLTTGQVAAILDERLHGPDRRAAIAHLSVCADCRHEVAELERAFKDGVVERPARRRWIIAVSGLAAAIVVAVLPLVRLPARPVVDTPSVIATRASGAVSPDDGVRPIATVLPADGAELAAAPALTWRSAGFGASYRVTLQDTSGAVLWSASLTDTTASIPPDVRLVRGRRYFWSVDARLGDGGSTGTGVRIFTIR